MVLRFAKSNRLQLGVYVGRVGSPPMDVVKYPYWDPRLGTLSGGS